MSAQLNSSIIQYPSSCSAVPVRGSFQHGLHHLSTFQCSASSSKQHSHMHSATSLHRPICPAYPRTDQHFTDAGYRCRQVQYKKASGGLPVREGCVQNIAIVWTSKFFPAILDPAPWPNSGQTPFNSTCHIRSIFGVENGRGEMALRLVRSDMWALRFIPCLTFLASRVLLCSVDNFDRNPWEPLAASDCGGKSGPSA